jgi:hypothetical protein
MELAMKEGTPIIVSKKVMKLTAHRFVITIMLAGSQS